MGGSETNEFLEGPRPSGADTLTPRGFENFIDYSQRSRRVVVDLTGRRRGGAAGEGDRIVSRFTGAAPSVRGGRGNDLLIGSNRSDSLRGGAGTDVLIGGPGGDSLGAGGFVDFDRPAAGPAPTRDRLLGGAGPDLLYGSNGPNRLDGGRGRDSVLGFGGRDLLLARDRAADELQCGSGTDRALLGPSDFFPAQGVNRCEVARRSVPGSAAQLGGSRQGPEESDAVGDERQAFLRVACPGDAPRVCRGRARLISRGRVLAIGSFSVRRNRSTLVGLKTTRYGRRTICRDEPLALAAVTSRDRFGRPRTTWVGENRFRCDF